MIGALRRSRLFFATAVLALLSAVPMAALPLLHAAGDDPSCEPRAAYHDSSAHRIGGSTGTPIDATRHCLVCHWSQWARAIQDEVLAVVPSIDSAELIAGVVLAPRTV